MSEKLRCDLNAVRADFETWRRRRIRRERIPDALWAAAVDLLDQYPISVVCRTLRLSPRDLRQRRAAAGHLPSHPHQGSGAFLELTARDLVTAARKGVNRVRLPAAHDSSKATRRRIRLVTVHIVWSTLCAGP